MKAVSPDQPGKTRSEARLPVYPKWDKLYSLNIKSFLRDGLHRRMYYLHKHFYFTDESQYYGGGPSGKNLQCEPDNFKTNCLFICLPLNKYSVPF